jgi:hypothetical protein
VPLASRLLTLFFTLFFGLPQANATPGSPFPTLSLRDREQYQLLYQRRVAVLRQRAAFMEKIAEGDFSGKHVLLRNAQVTAFLDVTDPRSRERVPEYHPELLNIPVERRAHILVVPNRKREHIGDKLDSKIRLGDLEASAQVLKAAEALAKRLGIRHANVFINPLDKLSVGYLHAHIMGERDPVPYPTTIVR